MSGSTAGGDELRELCEAVIEGRLTAEQGRTLERLVLGDESALRFYVDCLHQHACLRWSGADPVLLGSSAPVDAVRVRERAPSRHSRAFAFGLFGLSAAAAVILLALGFGMWSRGGPGGPPTYVATLVSGTSCQWGGGSLPTEFGTRLSAGRLRLNEGLARITFDRGAEVTIEAPADLELVSPQRCILHSGRLVGRVPPPAIGFTVDTPTAVIEDLGTVFGVNVREGRSADVQVFDGRVNVRDRKSGRVSPMSEGANLRFAGGDTTPFDPLAERPASGGRNPWSDVGSTRLFQVSTATGRGKDAYIRHSAALAKEGPPAILLVKNSRRLDEYDYNRKAYIGLDLAPVAGMSVVEAKLSVALAPTGMGYAAEVPDATFSVYGLTDESLEGWDERTIGWDDAPANRPSAAELDPGKVVLLGRFEVAQGMLAGLRDISGKDLVDFLNRDTNGLATLIIVRETMGSGRNDLVHGFAGKHHPDLPPPTLKMMAVPRRR